MLAGAASTLVLPKAARAAPSKVGASPLRLRRGVNLWPWFSLTTEYPAPRTDYAWPPLQSDRALPSREDLTLLSGVGFDFVRIPVDPGPMLAFSGQRRAALLQDLSRAIAACRDAGLNVVVNLQANAATHYWRPERMFTSRNSPEFSAYLELVGDLAAILDRNPPATVAIEPVNEPFHACGSRDWTRVQAAMLKASRKVAPDLTYVATSACGSIVPSFADFDAASVADGGPMLFTFHFYEPYLFTHQGATWMSEPVYRWLNAVPWPGSAGSLEATLAAVEARMAADPETPAATKQAAMQETRSVLATYFEAQPDRAYIQGFFDTMLQWADRNGLSPDSILMGEFGALRSGGNYVAAAAADQARYVRDVRLTAEVSGFGWAFWNLFDGFGLMDDVSHRLDDSLLDALGLLRL
nr:cellulase family glycosylhydrolase [Aurantimonas sp. VKM B-3413]